MIAEGGFDQSSGSVYLQRKEEIHSSPQTVKTPSGISTGTLHGVLWLTVEGRGTFQNSPELKLLVRSGIADGNRRMVLDLQRCSGMDSTFMGMLSCVAVKLEDAGGGLHVVNAGGKNGELLRGLGLDEVFTVEDGTEMVKDASTPCSCPPVAAAAVAVANDAIELEEVPKMPCTRQDVQQVCLEAHEALAEIKESNAEKFRDVIGLMKQESRAPEAVH